MNRLTSSPYFRRFLVTDKGKNDAQLRTASRGPHYDLRGFTFTTMKKNPAVLPLVVIIGAAVAGVVVYSTYAAFTRPDVSFNRKVYEWDTMDVMNPKQLKIRAYNQELGPMPELNEALSYREEYNKQNQSK
ncbi:uncharacterized protein LOC129778009 [Toxorhynchites rutilus septentrionalis]|uniref:uncharacterized protein LOC129778009 n=1 Tax=Toxorhynchites rutilus septentrionalis TaxID=329112 RepID=UPI00247A365C|nr:uncharacterized protein LOC129778009 [Toxorhynchites rutilus septentrionalis]